MILQILFMHCALEQNLTGEHDHVLHCSETYMSAGLDVMVFGTETVFPEATQD